MCWKHQAAYKIRSKNKTNLLEKHQQSSNRETVFSSSSENSHININYLFSFINIKAGGWSGLRAWRTSARRRESTEGVQLGEARRPTMEATESISTPGVPRKKSRARTVQPPPPPLDCCLPPPARLFCSLPPPLDARTKSRASAASRHHRSVAAFRRQRAASRCWTKSRARGQPPLEEIEGADELTPLPNPCSSTSVPGQRWVG